MKAIFKIFLFLTILNTLFGNSYNEALVILAQVMGIILVALCFLILYSYARVKFAIILLGLLIFSKVITLLFGFSIFYDLVYSFLFAITGSFVFRKYLHILKNQFLYYFFISGFILFFQISGWFPQLHLFNIYLTEYIENYGGIYGTEINFPNVLFTYGDRYTLFEQNQIYLSNPQNRPSGIFHSNAYLGPFMLIGYFFSIILFKKNNNSIFFIISTFFLLIVGSKLVFFCSLVCFIFNRDFFGNLYFRILALYLFSFLLYYLVFPTVFLSNYAISAIVYSFGIRLIDQLSLFGNFDFLFSSNIIDMYSSFDKDFQGSGIFTFFFIFLILILFYSMFKNKVIQYFKSESINSESKFLYRCLFIWLAFVFFSTPLFGNHLISFITGFLFTPYVSKQK